MKRRINYTGRKKIALENIVVRLNDPEVPGMPRSFTADITIPAALQLTPSAKVYVEPYVRTSSMRFPFGSVAAIIPPTDTHLSELDVGSDVLFRLRVVDETGHIGRILAAADEIRPRAQVDEADGRRSILPLVSIDLGEQVWRVSISGAAEPVLQINNRIPGLRERLLNDSLLQGAVYPEALRQILTHMVFGDAGDDETEWVRLWKKFAQELRKEEWPEDLDSEDDESACEELIRDLVERYCNHFKFASAARIAVEGI